MAESADLGALVRTCTDLIDERFPEDGDHGAAAMLLEDGTIVTGISPTAVNPAVELCHEVEPYCAAYRLNRRITASVCLHRASGGGLLVLSPCGVCRERLATHGPDVLVAVPAVDHLASVVWKPLAALLPDFWLAAFPDELDPGWNAST